MPKPSKIPKQMKIKRYRNSFGHLERRRKTRRVLLWAGTVVLLFVAGILIAKYAVPALRQYMANRPAPPPPSSLQTPSESTSFPDDSTSSPDGSTSQEPQSGPDGAAPLAQDRLSAEVTPAQLTEETAARLFAQGVTEAVVTMKDADGILWFQTSQGMAAGAQGVGALSPEALVTAGQAFARQGVTLTARLYAYRDTRAAQLNPAAGVWYGNASNVLWYDAEPAAGGRTWLSPYSKDAQGYVEGLAGELAQAGFQHIIISALQFPAVNDLSLTGYGDTGGVSMDQALGNAVSSLAALAGEKGFDLVFEWPGAAVGGQGLVPYGGVNPAALGAQGVLLTMTSAQKDQAAGFIAAARQAGALRVGVRYTDIAPDDGFIASLKADALAAGADWVCVG